MKFTTRSSYGLKALINLADRHGEAVPIRYISGKEKLSNMYLEQIFARLKKGGLVKSVRGPKGGYILAKDPAEINIYDVVRILEDNPSANSCMSVKCSPKTCKARKVCVVGEMLEGITVRIKDILAEVTLTDLAVFEEGFLKREKTS